MPWPCPIEVDSCHLEDILSVWSKVINVAISCFCLVLLHISVSTTGCTIPHNIASNGSILLDARHFLPSEEYFSVFYILQTILPPVTVELLRELSMF